MQNNKWVKLFPKEILLQLKEKEGFDFRVKNISSELGIPYRRVGELLRFYGIDYKINPNKPLGFEEWLRRSKEIHGDRYKYIISDYVSSHSLMTIFCSTHGKFKQKARLHLKGNGCRECGKQVAGDLERTPKEEFIRRCNEVHNYKFDYSTIHNYKNLDEHITFICPIHGKITQNGRSHMKGSDCVKCSYEKRGKKLRGSFEDFLTQARGKFGDTYSYIENSFTKMSESIQFVCKQHGIMEQGVRAHLLGNGCVKCTFKSLKGTTESFIKRAKEVHGDFYDYSKVNYIKNSKNVEIICKFHGSFFQRPNTHVDNKAGCSVCANIKSNFIFRNNEMTVVDIEASKNIPCKLYLLKFHTDVIDYYKIGLSCNFNKRLSKLKLIHGLKADIVKTVDSNLFDVANLESEILKKYKSYNKHGVPFGIEGSTECFSISLPVDEVMEYMESLKHFKEVLH